MSPPFQVLQPDGDNGNLILCGVSGWYNYQGSQYRDTDWFILTMGPTGNIEITADAEQPTYIFELGPQDCASAGVIQQATVGDCVEGFMTISGYASWRSRCGSGSARRSSRRRPVLTTMYDYVVWFTVPGSRPRRRPGPR